MYWSKLKASSGRRACTLAVALVAAASSANAVTLHDVFEKAWANSPQGRTAPAVREEAAVSRSVAESLFPGSPEIGLSQRSDRWNDKLGAKEHEVEISVPLWLPGQQAARKAVAAAGGEQAERGIRAARLAVAGELRTALWELYLARSETEVAAERMDSAAKLEADLARRVKVGEAARADLLLARQESASARAEHAAARAGLVRSTQRYRILTGSEQLPDNPQEAASASDSEHPRLAAGQAIAERARAELKLAQVTSRDSPTLGMQYRRERDAFAARPRASMGFTFTIQLATRTRNAPLIASATTTLVRAEAEYRQLHAEVAAAASEGEAALEANRIGAELAVEREQAAAERLALMRRSFELGETSLVEFLRTSTQASEARIEVARSRARHFAAIANINQVRGITP